MMKTKTKMFMAVAGAAFMLSSCAAVKTPLAGGFYTEVKAPVAVTSNSKSDKVGTSVATSYLGLVATGDASIEAAAKSAGITKIHHVDEQAKSILGIFSTYTIFVYGE